MNIDQENRNDVISDTPLLSEENGIMKRPDVLEMLEREKRWYLDEIRRINRAIAAVKEDQGSTDSEAARIPWKKKIKEVMAEREPLTMKQVRDLLAENGIPEAVERKYKPTVYSTLMRMVKQGELTKADGAYWKTEEEPAEGEEIPF